MKFREIFNEGMQDIGKYYKSYNINIITDLLKKPIKDKEIVLAGQRHILKVNDHLLADIENPDVISITDYNNKTIYILPKDLQLILDVHKKRNK